MEQLLLGVDSVETFKRSAARSIHRCLQVTHSCCLEGLHLQWFILLNICVGYDFNLFYIIFGWMWVFSICQSRLVLIKSRGVLQLINTGWLAATTGQCCHMTQSNNFHSNWASQKLGSDDFLQKSFPKFKIVVNHLQVLLSTATENVSKKWLLNHFPSQEYSISILNKPRKRISWYVSFQPSIFGYVKKVKSTCLLRW